MGNKEPQDKFLLVRLKKDDEKAFREIYTNYHQQLFHVAKRYLRSKELAEDAVQDIFVKLWNNRKRLKGSGSLRGFLFTSLKNHVLNMVNRHKRKLRKEVELIYEKEMEEETSNVIALSDYREHYDIAVQQLPEKRREVFRLRINEGLTNREVAEYLNISINTVKSQYYKATLFIKKYMKENIHSRTGS